MNRTKNYTTACRAVLTQKPSKKSSSIMGILAVSSLAISLPSTSCVSQAAFPAGIAANSSFSNNPNAVSNHHKFSQSYADKHIRVGVDDVLSIPVKFGTPVYESKDSQGDLVWVYQARTSAVSTQGKFGSNYKAGLMSGSTASAFEVMTEAGKRSTTLKVAFRKNGKVKNYKSEAAID